MVSDNAFAAGSALGADAVVSFGLRRRHDVNYFSRTSEPNQSLDPKFAYCYKVRNPVPPLHA